MDVGRARGGPFVTRKLLVGLAVALTCLAAGIPQAEAQQQLPQVAAAPVDEQLARAEAELRSAEANGSQSSARERKTLAASALEHFEQAYETEPSWRAAAGACDANLVLEQPAAASGWYWLASDKSDYSEAYLAWQTRALTRVFDNRAAFTFEYSRTPATMRVDGVALPVAALDRPVALDPGMHNLVATAEDGDGYKGSLMVTADQVGGRHFHYVPFQHMLRAGEDDPLGTTVKARPKADKEGMGALQIISIVSTVALASGIAIGGGYLLFGEENPRGIDTPEGAAVITVELLVIGGGTAIALLSDG